MSTSDQIYAQLFEMKKRQRYAFNLEQQLRIGQVYLNKKLRKCIEAFDLAAICAEADAGACNIKLWVRYQDEVENLLIAIEPDRRCWRHYTATDVYQRLTQYSQGALKGNIFVSVHWAEQRPPKPEAAALPQKQEN